MNSKKYFVFITTLATFLIGLNTTLWGQEQKDPNDEIKVLQEKIEQLESVIETQQKTINELKMKLDEQIKENERLKGLCKQAGVRAELIKDADVNSEKVVYHGKERNQWWLEKMYEYFKDKIVFWNGNYIDISEILLGESYKAVGGLRVFKRGNSVIPENTLARLEGAEVLSVLGNGEILTIEDGDVLHIHGLTESYVDGQRIWSRNIFIPTGTYNYTSATGALKTVRSYLICGILSKEHFTQLVNRGIDLGEYEVVLKDYTTLRTLNENEYSFSENKVDGSVTIKKGDRIIKRLGKGKYHFEIVPKPSPTKGR